MTRKGVLTENRRVSIKQSVTWKWSASYGRVVVVNAIEDVEHEELVDRMRREKACTKELYAVCGPVLEKYQCDLEPMIICAYGVRIVRLEARARE